MVQPSGLQFASFHRRSSSLIFYLEIQSSSTLRGRDERSFLHGELGGLVGRGRVRPHDFLGSREHVDERRRVLRDGVALARESLRELLFYC